MRQHLFRIYREKLQSRRAETLAELLVSVLVIVLALTSSSGWKKAQIIK